jgi:hypothetical protein
MGNNWLVKTALLFSAGIFLLVSSCKQREQKTFEVLNSSLTNIEFQNKLLSNEKLGILYYINYYNGAGVAAGDINNDGLTDLYFVANNNAGNKLYLNKGNFVFEDITETAGVAGNADWCTGVTMADINADGFLDIYVCAVSKKHGLKGRNQLFINNGNNSFTEKAAEYGLDFSGYSTQAAFFDYDHDGDLDCYLLNQSSHPHQYVVDTSYRRKLDANAGDILYRNELGTGQKKFTNVSAQAGIYQSFLGFGLGLAIADINNDGWEDIYVGNDFHENDYYYVNNGNGTFTESGAKVFNHYSRFSMGNDIADYDNDGNLDIVTVDMLPPDEKILKTYGSDERVDVYNFKILNKGYQPQFSRNCLQHNNGNGKSFSELGLAAGISATDWSWSPLMNDFDNDGFKDLFVASGIVKRTADLDYVRFVTDLARQKSFNNSASLDDKALEKMPDGRSNCFMFRGNGKGNFEEQSEQSGIAHKKGYYTGAAYADFDNDGDLDIVVNAIDEKAFIYKNNSAGKNYIQLQFRGDSLNTKGLGVKTYLFQQGRMQYQQLMLTRGFQSSSFERLHFGLDSLTAIDSLLVVWPDGSYQLIKNPAVNKLITIEKKNAAGKFIYEDHFPIPAPPYVLMESPMQQQWKHRENPIDDFNQQYLIPHALSIRGPKIAVGDINKDGLDDFYACGAAGQPGQLFMQNSAGKFLNTDSLLFAPNAEEEEVDAAFFDANGDSWPDLYIATGGNNYKNGDQHLLDRLYLNNGKGQLQPTTGKLPQILSNKSTLSIGDLDNDGDADVFIGTLADPADYGLPQTSYVLLNDGKGNFAAAPAGFIDLEKIGMVTSSVIADINNDNKNDLIIAGEWMPLVVYLNKGNKLAAERIEASSGWWQTLRASDVNGDGYIDILAGNWGLNSKLSSKKNGPLRMYIKDIDNNGKSDPLLVYNINGQEYPFLPKDEIEQAVPAIKKQFLFYTDYAGKPVQELFDLASGNTLSLEAEEMASCVFINNGKGSFTKQILPFEYQLTPIFCFQQAAGNNSFLAGGNFFGVLPYEGQYDAVSLMQFSITAEEKHIGFNKPTVMPDLRGQVRDLKWLQTKNGKILVVARNNGGLLFLKSNEK